MQERDGCEYEYADDGQGLKERIEEFLDCLFLLALLVVVLCDEGIRRVRAKLSSR